MDEVWQLWLRAFEEGERQAMRYAEQIMAGRAINAD